MQQYTLSMTSRMLAIAALCVFLLCVLLFLLGIEIGKRLTDPAAAMATGMLPTVTFATPQMPAMPALPAAPALPSTIQLQAPAMAAPAAQP